MKNIIIFVFIIIVAKKAFSDNLEYSKNWLYCETPTIIGYNRNIAKYLQIGTAIGGKFIYRLKIMKLITILIMP